MSTIMRENFVFLAIFDTCDVMFNWFISLLPPIVLDDLFVKDCKRDFNSPGKDTMPDLQRYP